MRAPHGYNQTRSLVEIARIQLLFEFLTCGSRKTTIMAPATEVVICVAGERLVGLQLPQVDRK